MSFTEILMVVFCTLCEGMEDLEPFYPERMASRILGMGDIATFLEKAQVNTATVYSATKAVLYTLIDLEES